MSAVGGARSNSSSSGEVPVLSVDGSDVRLPLAVSVFLAPFPVPSSAFLSFLLPAMLPLWRVISGKPALFAVTGDALEA